MLEGNSTLIGEGWELGREDLEIWRLMIRSLAGGLISGSSSGSAWMDPCLKDSRLQMSWFRDPSELGLDPIVVWRELVDPLDVEVDPGVV